MKTNTLNSKTNSEMSIVSNCSIMTLLGMTPQGLMYTDGVTYTFVDIEKEKGLAIEHKATSRAPLSQNTLRLLDYLLLNIDPDNHVRISGSELVDVFGSIVNVVGYLQAIRQVEIHTRITNSETQKSVHHRFGIVESVSFDDVFGCKEWAEVRPDTIIDIKLYDHFCDIYLGHIIPDYQISVDYVALGQKGLIGEIAKEFVDDARAKIEMEKTERPDEKNEEGRDEDGDNKEAAPKNSVKQVDDNTLVLISVRQLNRIFGDDHDDEFEIADGFLLKYHGQGGDIVIPKSVIVICDHAFEGCAGLTSVTIPNSVKLIGKDAFKDCANLVEVDMPFYLLKSVAPCIEMFFDGTEIATLLKRDSDFWNRYAAEMKAEIIEEAEDKEDDNGNDKDENEEGDMDGENEENGKENDDNGGGATNGLA